MCTFVETKKMRIAQAQTTKLCYSRRRGGEGQMFSRRARVHWRLDQRFVAHRTTRAYSQMVLATSLPRILT